MTSNSHVRQGRPWSIYEYSLLVLVAGLGFWNVRNELADIVRIAIKDNEQSHILLVPIIALWLLYLRKVRIRYMRCQPSVVGVLMILAGWTMNWLGHETDTIVLEHTGAMLLMLGAIISVAGMVVLRQFLPVIVVFAFAIPVPGVIRQLIAIPLQNMAATVTKTMLDFAGIASEQVGYSLVVNGTQVAVGEACNGMRMVFALTLVVYAFVFSVPLRRSIKILLLLLSPGIALLCNVVRLVPTALVYGYGSAATAEQFHDMAGWIMLPIALALLIAVLRVLNWLELPVTQWRLS